MIAEHGYTDGANYIVGKWHFNWTWSGLVRFDYDDLIYARGGNDTVIAAGGDDTVFAGDGADIVYGGTGDDWIYGSAHGPNQGPDTLFGEDGNDNISGGYGGGLLSGGRGHDRILGTSGDHSYTIEGGEGNDVLGGGGANDYLDGDEGDDTLGLSNGWDTVLGGTGNDLITMPNFGASSWTAQNFGIAEINGGAGYDVLDLSPATLDLVIRADVLGGVRQGVFGVEEVLTGRGRDVITDIEGLVVVDVGGGFDTVFAGDHSQDLSGGSDFDALVMTAAARSTSGVTLFTDPARGATAYLGNGKASKIRDFEKFTLTDRDDRFYGADANEEVRAGAGADVLIGESGNDTLFGETGTDMLNGGKGDDRLWGGNQADTFHFDINTAFGHDTIGDYQAQDTITLDTNGAMVGRIALDQDGDDAVISVLGRPDASIRVIGAAEMLSLDDLDITGGFAPLTFDDLF
ncbi:MAG: calcium-binding protein [Pseudomonadota bacterium]